MWWSRVKSRRVRCRWAIPLSIGRRLYHPPRGVEIERQGNQIVFITKGDDNDSHDPPVLEAAYKGKVVLQIPKLGWLSIYIRRLLAGLSG